MKTAMSSCLLTVIPFLGLTATAQEPPPPSPELEKYDVLLGTWEVSGTSKETPDGPDLPWTAVQTVQRVLGGYFLRDEMVIDTGMGKMVFLGFTGWDAETERFMTYVASNMGAVSSAEMFVPTPNTFVSAAVNVMEGQAITERAVLNIDGDSYSFSAQQAIGGGPFFTMVEGTGKRVSKEVKAQAVDAGMGMFPAAPEMKMWEKMAGQYEVVGSMAAIPGSGLPDMAINGTETISMTLGGTIMQQYVTGQSDGGPDLYEAFGFSTWNARDKCYDIISVDSMGMGQKFQIREVDDHTMVGTAAAMQFGQPVVSRTILKLDDNGAMSAVTVDGISGVAPPQRMFSATYTKKR